MADTSQTAARPKLTVTTRTVRPTLHLKTRPLPVPAPAPVDVAERWKCKPCGALLEIDAALADEAVVRCPACNARLGRAEQFRASGDGAVRARRA